LIGSVVAEGLEAQELQHNLIEKYKNILKLQSLLSVS